MPTKLKRLKKTYGNREFYLLDVGAGNHSATQLKKYFPNCKYYGIDISKDYNNDAEDFNLMENFWEKDLTKLDFSDIPDGFFDALLMTHIIEHLYNGELVVDALLNKVKTNGFIYLEYPSQKSTRLPSKKGTLNFYDDDTHVRLYNINVLIDIIKSNGFTVLKFGARKDFANIMTMPIRIIISKIKHGYVPGGVFWDLLGFAEFIWAKKKV
ncbi:MAG: methyltransferase domain-containing protein [bacterium]